MNDSTGMNDTSDAGRSMSDAGRSMTAEDVDIVVIGMGPGGETAAADLARAGLKVVGIDRHLVGGECPYYGCIPSKMMVRAANLVAEAGRVPALAGRAQTQPDFEIVADRIRNEATDDWNDQVAVDRFQQAGGLFVRGSGRLMDPRTVRAGGRSFRARRAIILNTGTDPAVPPVAGLARTPYWTNRDIVQASAAPDTLAILGGGTIGVEFGQAFARFGSTVQIVEVADTLLPGEEPEAGRLLARVFDAEGIGVHTGEAVERVSHDGDGFTLVVAGEEIAARRLLVAAGRRSNIGDIGLETLGLDPDAPTLATDSHMRIAEQVYAIGDITGRGGFTHMSMYEGRIAVADILGERDIAAEDHAVPRVTFTDPEVGAVGLTEKQARAAGMQVATATSRIPDSARGWIHGPGNDGFVKLVADSDRGILVGATSAGPSGGEILGLLTLAVHDRVTLTRLRDMIYAYPTFHRAIRDALDRLPDAATA
jgi:pyruvate/2-oxoglutarate dehydrogenase complex dihydrolipoamide dehydrogenase (E3) component